MRIALCTESFPPSISGVAVFASRTAEELHALGHEVIVIAPNSRGKLKRELWQHIPVYRIRSVRNPFQRKRRLVVGQQISVSKVLKQFKPDIIHIQDLGGCSAASLRWGRRHKVPVVGTRHFTTGLVVSYLNFAKVLPKEVLNGLIEAYVQEFYNLCTVLTCPTETVKESILLQGYKGPVEVLSNGVDILPLPKISARNKQEVPILLTVSRIDEDKNLLLLLRSAPLVYAKHKVRFVVIGDGNQLKACQLYVKRHAMEDYVQFVGALKARSAALMDWYTRATLFVIPSLIETQSIVTLEAMSMALPVVAVRSGALPELVRPRETGYLAPLPTPVHFAKTIIAALDNSQDLATLGLNGRALVEREHERSRCVALLVNVYEKALAGEY